MHATPSAVQSESVIRAQRTTTMSTYRSNADSDVDMETASQGSSDTPSSISGYHDSSDGEGLSSQRPKKSGKAIQRSATRTAEPFSNLWEEASEMNGKKSYANTTKDWTPQPPFSPGSSSYAQSSRPAMCRVCSSSLVKSVHLSRSDLMDRYATKNRHILDIRLAV